MALRDLIVNNYLAKPVEDMEAIKATEVAPLTVAPTQVKNVVPGLREYAPTAVYQGGGAMENMWKMLNKDIEPESKEQSAAREKRERRNQTLYSLADGLSHIANIWGTTQGATPINLSSLSDVNRQRYEYAKQQREKNSDAWKRGIFQSRMADVESRQAGIQAQMKAAVEEQKRRDKLEKEKRDTEMAERKFKLDEKKFEADQELSKKKFEEDVRSNKVKERISQTNANTARERVEIDRNKGTGKDMKVARFALADGSNITVPEDMKYDYYADVFNVLSQEAEKSGDNSVIEFMESNAMLDIPKSSVMRDAVHSYAKKYPAVQEYMKQRAQAYMDYYDNPPAPKITPSAGSPQESFIPGVNENYQPKGGWGNSLYDPDDEFIMN